MENKNINRIVPPANEYYSRVLVLQDSSTGKVLPYHVLNVEYKWGENDVYHTAKFVADRKGVIVANFNSEWIFTHFYVTNLQGKLIEQVTYEFIESAEYTMIDFISELGEVGTSYRDRR